MVSLLHPPTPPPVISARHRPIGDCMAFTLVELLTVITIVAVLAALVIPTVSSAFRKGYEADAAQDLSSLYQATMLYVAENNGEIFFLMLSGNPPENTGPPLGWRDLWPDKLTPYLPAVGTITQTNGRNGAFYNKKIKMANRWIVDYGANDNIMFNNDTSQVPRAPLRFSNVREPAKELMFVETANNTATRKPETSGAFTFWARMMARGNLDYDNTIARRHGPTNNPAFYAVFCDGHTERINFNSFSNNNSTALRYQMFSANPNGISIYW